MTTRRQLAGGLIAVALFGALISVGASSAHAQKAPKVTKTGWWIRINGEKTKASTVYFRIGTSKKDSREWRSWTVGQRLEFDLPAELRNAPNLHIRATSDPRGKHVVFCVFYMDHGVEHFGFDGDVDKNMEQTDADEDCKP